MSAIAAIWGRGPRFDTVGGIDSLLASLSPASQTACSWSGSTPGGPVALGCVLQQFTPEDAFERQPLWSADHAHCLVADVRLDNREELAAALDLSAGPTVPDSALLLAAWERWGPACLKHLLGSFAFAVWTPARQELFAARDHTGESPLFFHCGSDFFALASMPKGLRAITGVGERVDETWIADWLVSAIPEGRSTFFQGIERLLAGHFLQVTPHSVKVERYWSPADAPPIRFRRDSDYAEALVEVLDRSTAPRLRRIGSVACQLSAGLDSASVMASAAILLARSGEPLRAYTSVPQSGFSTESYSTRPVVDEGPFAAEAAALYPNVTYVPFTVGGMPLLSTVSNFSDALDEPMLNGINSLWIAGILEDARKNGFGVVLQGFAGNATFSFESLSVAARWLQTGQWFKVLRHIYTLRAEGEMGGTNAIRGITKLALPMFEQRRRWRRGVRFDRGGSLIHPDFVRAQKLPERAIAHRVAFGADYRAERHEFFLRVDPGRVNAASRALGQIDVRDPTNDKRLWEYVNAIPYTQFAVDGHTRSLARRAMRGRLPDATLDRYRQGRQGADWYLTMREALPELREEARLIAQCEPAARMLDVPKMQWLLDNFPTSGYGTIPVMHTWKYSLMRAISLGNFLRRRC